MQINFENTYQFYCYLVTHKYKISLKRQAIGELMDDEEFVYATYQLEVGQLELA